MRHLDETTSTSKEALEQDALKAAALQWAGHDPDPATVAQLHALIAEEPLELADSFTGNLQFGTAGLRAAMGPGPNRMNRIVVRRAAAGVAAHLLALARQDALEDALEGGDGAQSDGAQEEADDAGTSSPGSPAYQPRAVVGFDARHNSEIFAKETAAIFAAAGIQTFLLPSALPTPVLAYAVRSLACEAGVMVTASHNPPADNGYKVYLGGRAVAPEARGVQIVAPHDSKIAAHIDAAANTAEMGDTSNIELAASGWTVLEPELLEGYRHAVTALADRAAFPHRELRIVHTSLHGVGHETALAVLRNAGFTDIHAVPEQSAPDPLFPTVSFPNPEEPGAMDLAFALAEKVGADLVLANDPDADRVSVGAKDPDSGQWRQLHGDQVGALLGAHVAARGGRVGSSGARDGSAGARDGSAGARDGSAGTGSTPVFANSIVSSRLLAKIAADAGYDHVQTLTGFKWISRVPFLTYGYEEALGYCVAPEVVRDKDGISAGLLVAETAAGLKAVGRTLFAALDDLALAHGLHASNQISIRVEDPAEIEGMMARLRSQPPASFDGSAVAEFTDLSVGTPRLPSTDGVSYLSENGARVIVRPSGTEPKLKCYLEVIVPVAGRDQLPAAQAEAQRALAAVVHDVKAALGLEPL